MGTFWKTNANQRSQILEAYKQGEPIETIAERYGIHDSYVCRLAEKAGIAMRGRGHWATQNRLAEKAENPAKSAA